MLEDLTGDRAALPLGVFDSGLGGLTVVHSLMEALPDERIVYLGDTARVPYGTRSAQTVIRYARGCARVLTARGIKALIVACNTVSAVALEMLRADFDLPVIGVIEPGAEAAVRASLTHPGRIGVLGTPGTVASGAYPRAVAQLSTRLEVLAQAAPLLVPLVEEGWLEGQVPELAVERYTAPLITAGARVIVLGCTHYPLLKPVVVRIAARLAVGEAVTVVDSAEATAQAVRRLLDQGRILRAPPRKSSEPRLALLVTDLPAGFRAVAQRFLDGQQLPEVEQVDLVAG